MTVLSGSSNEAPSAIDCGTAVRRLWDFLDGRLTSLERAEVEHHLATCAKCPPHFAFAEHMKASLAGVATPPISDDDEARLRDRVRAALGRIASETDDDGARNSS